MGTAYRHWLVARGNVFLPSAETILKLVGKLREGGWIADVGAYAAKNVEVTGNGPEADIRASREPLPAELSRAWFDHPTREELRLVWPVSSGAKYPLSRKPDGPVATTLEIHRAPEYVYPTAENIEVIDTECRCGEDQAFEWDPTEVVPPFGNATGIFAECEECSRTFDPAKVEASIDNPFDGSSAEVRGGAAYRFAVAVTATDVVPDARIGFAKELVALIEKELGREFYEFGTIS